MMVTIPRAARKAGRSDCVVERVIAQHGVPVSRIGRVRVVEWAALARALAADARAETIAQARARTGVPRYLLRIALREAGYPEPAAGPWRLQPEAFDAALRCL